MRQHPNFNLGATALAVCSCFSKLGETCKKAYCRESEEDLGLNEVADVEIIELDDDNNVFVDTFSALDSSIAVESGKFAGADFGNGELNIPPQLDQITWVFVQAHHRTIECDCGCE